LQRAAEAGDNSALTYAADLLEKAGRAEEAIQLRQYGIEPLGPHRRWPDERPE